MEKYGVIHDFTAIMQYCMAKSKFHRVENVAADKIGVFTDKANAILMTDETNTVMYKEYTDILQITRDLDPMMWIDYEIFHNQVVIPREKKNADAVVPAAVNIEEAKKDQKPVIQSNFAERFTDGFNSFT